MAGCSRCPRSSWPRPPDWSRPAGPRPEAPATAARTGRQPPRQLPLATRPAPAIIPAALSANRARYEPSRAQIVPFGRDHNRQAATRSPSLTAVPRPLPLLFLPWPGSPDGGRARCHGLAASPVSSLPGQAGISHPPVAYRVPQCRSPWSGGIGRATARASPLLDCGFHCCRGGIGLAGDCSRPGAAVWIAPETAWHACPRDLPSPVSTGAPPNPLDRDGYGVA
jgi:hypothetical protein